MKLSIITINYNNREGFQKTIDSVISQTWRDFEWIIIDGGSTDGSRNLIEKYKNDFAYWCSEQDNGVYNAMNKGIAKATGDYLIFMNSGDIFYSRNILESVMLQNYNEDIITGNVITQDKGCLLRQNEENVVLQLMRNTLNHQGSFIKRKLLIKFPYDESLQIVSDWKFWIQSILCDNCTLRQIDTIIAVQDMTGISSNNSKLISRERELALSNLIPERIKRQLYIDADVYNLPLVNNILYLFNHNKGTYVWAHRFIKALTLTCKKINKITKKLKMAYSSY